MRGNFRDEFFHEIIPAGFSDERRISKAMNRALLAFGIYRPIVYRFYSVWVRNDPPLLISRPLPLRMNHILISFVQSRLLMGSEFNKALFLMWLYYISHFVHIFLIQYVFFVVYTMLHLHRNAMFSIFHNGL